MSKIKDSISRHKEFAKLKRLERIREYLSNPNTYVLNDRDNKYLRELLKCFSIMQTTRDKEETITKLYAVGKILNENLRISHVKRIVRDTERVLGRILRYSTQLTKIMASERYMKLHNAALEVGKIEVATHCLTKAAKLNQLLNSRGDVMRNENQPTIHQ